jgi:hypothetical protein
MKPRSEWLCYVALLFTSGYFAFVWIVLLANDVNRVTGRRIFPVMLLSLALAGIVAVYLSLVFFSSTIAAELNVARGNLFILVGVQFRF